MLGWFAETTLVASALAMVAVLIGRFRSIGPTVRHALWLVVLIKMMTPPVVYWPWAVSWQSAVWPTMSLSTVAASPSIVGDSDRQGDESSPQSICHNEIAPTIESASSWDDFTPGRSHVHRSAAAEAVVATALPAARVWRLSLADLTRLNSWLIPAWLVISVVLGIGQASRIIRFRRKLWLAVPAPDDLLEEVGRIGKCLGVAVPDLLVVPDLGTPLLWCLGRPKLLIPARLVKTIAFDHWQGILTHELAHLRRGDQWVSRLELAAGLIWWWNPLYWLTRARLDANAELACDAWVVWALPKDRLNYAKVLVDICATLSPAGSLAPTLGVAGSGRFLERRLTMILYDHVSCRLSSLGLLGACLLLLFALPSWSAASLVDVDKQDTAATATMTVTPEPDFSDPVNDDDDDDDDDDDRAAARTKQKVEKPKAKIKVEKSGSEDDLAIDLSRLEKEIESKFGPGSEFEKKMEAFGKEIESKFGPGSEFEKKMEAFGKEIESKFGSGSEFEKKAEAFGKEIESKFGPGSEFEKKMKAFGEEMKEKYSPKSEFARKIREQAESDARPAPTPTPGPKPAPSEKPQARSRARDQRRERRIKELETQIGKLMDEIKALKAGTDRVDSDND